MVPPRVVLSKMVVNGDKPHWIHPFLNRDFLILLINHLEREIISLLVTIMKMIPLPARYGFVPLFSMNLCLLLSLLDKESHPFSIPKGNVHPKDKDDLKETKERVKRIRLVDATRRRERGRRKDEEDMRIA